MPATPRPVSGFSKTSSAMLLCAATVLLLTMSFPNYLHGGFWPLAMVALAPMALCIVHRPLWWRWLGLYYLAGLLFFVPMLFWLWPVTFWGTFALALYLALYFVLFAAGFHRLVTQMRVPATLALPIVWTACEYVRGTFLEGGFPMLTVGNVFAALGFLKGAGTVVMQSADLFGVWGLTFIAMVINGLLVDLLRLPPKLKGKEINPTIFKLAGTAGGVMIFVAGYGFWRLSQYPSVTRQGPLLAVIQENITQDIKDDPDNYMSYFEKHMKLSQRAIDEIKPEMVIWPETMAPYPFNKSYMDFLEHERPLARQYLDGVTLNPAKWDDNTVAYAKNILERYHNVRLVIDPLRLMADKGNMHLLVGNSAVLMPNEERQNTAVMISPGKGEVQRYAKVHLVPFGEYIPFSSRGSWLREKLRSLTPLSFDYSLLPGNEWTVFTLPRGDKEPAVRFAVPICFEDIMPGPSRAMAAVGADGKKRAEFLVNISNDGWFHRTELDLHLQACRIRAVENRVPIARSVNTGNSGFIDSCGRVVELIEPGAIDIRGGHVMLDSRITLYSRIGDLLPILCGIAGVVLTAWTFIRPRRGRKA